jgi:hypothetical protein
LAGLRIVLVEPARPINIGAIARVMKNFGLYDVSNSQFPMQSAPKRTMPRITLEVSEELSQQLAQVGDRLPELLALSLQQPAVPAQVYRYILDFLASNPTPEQIAEFKPTPEMQERLRTLLTRSQAGELTSTELQELDEYERIEHLIVMIKAGNLPYLTS